MNVRISSVEKQLLSKDLDKLLQKRNVSEWKKRNDRLTKSDEWYHYRDGSSLVAVSNKRRSAPSSPSYESA